jgi:hypothetical protein
MDVLIMDVEGTDSRERGEEQVFLFVRRLIAGFSTSLGAIFSGYIGGHHRQYVGAPSWTLPRL